MQYIYKLFWIAFKSPSVLLRLTRKSVYQLVLEICIYLKNGDILRSHNLNSKPITINVNFKAPSLCLWMAYKKLHLNWITYKKTTLQAGKEETHWNERVLKPTLLRILTIEPRSYFWPVYIATSEFYFPQQRKELVLRIWHSHYKCFGGLFLGIGWLSPC